MSILTVIVPAASSAILSAPVTLGALIAPPPVRLISPDDVIAPLEIVPTPVKLPPDETVIASLNMRLPAPALPEFIYELVSSTQSRIDLAAPEDNIPIPDSSLFASWLTCSNPKAF